MYAYKPVQLTKKQDKKTININSNEFLNRKATNQEIRKFARSEKSKIVFIYNNIRMKVT